MSQIKHTPGPHEVVGTTVYALEFDSWRKGIEQMRNRIWANVQGYKDTPKEEVEATARLYSAAPDLLAALNDLFGADMEYCMRMDGKDDQIEAIAKARSAIAKALGEAP